MEFIDLKTQYARIEPQIRARLDAVLEHGRFIMGPEVKELEERLAATAGAKHCLTCGSGTMALDLVLAAWKIGSGDAVFTTPFTFIATAESIARTGAIPVFVDIRLEDFNLDASRLEQAVQALLHRDASIHPLPVQAQRQSLTPRAIITVDLFGHPADYAAILPVARKYGLLVLEDAAQSFGGNYKGLPLCGCGADASAASFFPAKPLGCYGDGGAIFTDDDKLAALLDSLRYHGRASHQDKYNNIRLGTNGRMDTLQAAILLAKLDIFADEIAVRQQVAATYAALLADVPGVTPPKPPENGTSVWAQYTILLQEGIDRNAVAARMKAKGIPTTITYPKALHMQGAFADLAYIPDNLPVAHGATRRVLSLPMHPYLTYETQKIIVDTLQGALCSQGEATA